MDRYTHKYIPEVRTLQSTGKSQGDNNNPMGLPLPGGKEILPRPVDNDSTLLLCVPFDFALASASAAAYYCVDGVKGNESTIISKSNFPYFTYLTPHYAETRGCCRESLYFPYRYYLSRATVGSISVRIQTCRPS